MKKWLVIIYFSLQFMSFEYSVHNLIRILMPSFEWNSAFRWETSSQITFKLHLKRTVPVRSIFLKKKSKFRTWFDNFSYLRPWEAVALSTVESLPEWSSPASWLPYEKSNGFTFWFRMEAVQLLEVLQSTALLLKKTCGCRQVVGEPVINVANSVPFWILDVSGGEVPEQ